MNETITQPEQFERFGCVLVENFVDETTIKTISKYLENKIRRNEWFARPQDAVTNLWYYADPLIEVVLESSLDKVSEVCGKDLYPTYSYARIYQPGEELKPHLDRPSCEISVTVNVASKGEPSPIWMKYKDNEPHSYLLSPGDAIIYKGCEATHWRTPFKQDQLNVQFMMHYVDKFGSHAEKIFDNRPNVGFSPNDNRRM